jgi:hypothetical protein
MGGYGKVMSAKSRATGQSVGAGWTYEAAVRVTVTDSVGDSRVFQDPPGGVFEVVWEPDAARFQGPISFVGEGGRVWLGSGLPPRTRHRTSVPLETLLQEVSETAEKREALLRRISEMAEGAAPQSPDGWVQWGGQPVEIRVTNGSVIRGDGSVVPIPDVTAGAGWSFDPNQYSPIVIRATFTVTVSCTVATHAHPPDPPTDTADIAVRVSAVTMIFN